MEDIFTRYETMANNKLPEDTKTVIMMELCTPDLKENLEFSGMSYMRKHAKQ